MMSYLIAEIGWNFIGNLSLAKKMILEAKRSGADAVKFQIWNPKYLKKGEWDYDGRRKIYEKAFLDEKKYKILKKFSKQNSIKCFASVFNIDALNMIKKMGDNWVKIPSHEAYNLDLIELAFKKFKKVIISLGCLKRKELQKVLNLILKNKQYKKKATLLHCVSSYPLNPEDCNFEKFDYIKKKFYNTGYSGHLNGIDDALLALSKGATFVEKHFTINNNLQGRDNKFAILPYEFKILSNYRNNLIKFKKKKGLGLLMCEKDIYKNYRGRWSKKIN
jgi:N-acetylneuraminate synthase